MNKVNCKRIWYVLRKSSNFKVSKLIGNDSKWKDMANLPPISKVHQMITYKKIHTHSQKFILLQIVGHRSWNQYRNVHLSTLNHKNLASKRNWMTLNLIMKMIESKTLQWNINNNLLIIKSLYDNTGLNQIFTNRIMQDSIFLIINKKYVVHLFNFFRTIKIFSFLECAV